MNTINKLAIVIPAYKILFFKETIESIANQTCKDFILYIGDDASPYKLNTITNSFQDKINIVYKRFEINYGSKDLVAHWNRCTNLVKNENWIWLFSDDDLMDINCVEQFYKHIKQHPDDNLLHFNVRVINEKNKYKYKTKKFPPHFTTMDFFSKRLKNQISSFAIEYIFKKEYFEKVGGFQSFDLAWSSDNATWMKLAHFNGINTIDGAMVQWRFSKSNISSIVEDRDIVLRKINSNINYLNWTKPFFNQNGLTDITSGMEKARWITSLIAKTYALSYREKYNLTTNSLYKLNLEKLKFRILLVWIFREFKKNTKYILYFEWLKK